ncbi:FitA-like ribbon-helix-helix domain-containing protein [Rhizobium rhizogenes]|uniref:FitA-like ribbon-helix-helix domain-containing protein n=1 Tax=Rhizobium rhizogenes TaxID=359 RepID=UPI0015716AEC|nr:plasmid stabilization protein [Rhizobium rhizogenes]NTF85923.1 plasmid stabilization protein [Rhizobium rhizogenes]
MSDLLIRDISDAMKQDIAERAKQTGRSLSEEAKVLLRKALLTENDNHRGGLSAWEALRPIFFDESDPEAGEEFARIMDEIEAERKKDFGRPVEEFE